ncbi:MAG: 3'-5' exonuclease [Myxococcaceae bacterium]|nr:3'-5' exonuclease [Myxococcaceae bacterium]
MLGSLLQRHLFLDLETTGLDAGADEVIELGAVLVVNGEIERQHDWLIRPTRPVPAVISALTGLTDDDLAGAASYDELLPVLRPLFDGVTVVAHNALFERAFLRGLLDDVPVLDSCELALVLFPELPSHSLDALVQWAGLAGGSQHRALDDARDTFGVVKALLERACEPARRSQLAGLAARVSGHAPLHRLLSGLADAAFHAAAPKPPLRDEGPAVQLPAVLKDWARTPSPLALELEVRDVEALALEAARQTGAAVWLVCPHARLKHLGGAPRLPSRSSQPNAPRLSALLSRRVVLDPALAASMAYLESWGARAAASGAPLSGFWRDRVPLFDSLRTLARGRATGSPPAGLFVGTHHEVAEWLEAGVHPDALVWLDAPTAIELERRRLTVSLELSRVFRLPEVAELAAPGRPLSAGLQAVHARAKELAQTLSVFPAPAIVDRTGHEPWLALRDALTALGRDLAWWLSELRSAPPTVLLEGVLGEASALAELIPRLCAPDELTELWASASGVWLRPPTALCEASFQALARSAPSLFVSDVRRAPGWERRLGATHLAREGRAEPARPLAVADQLGSNEALAAVALAAARPVTVVSGDPLSEPLVAAFVERAKQQGRRVRLNQAGAGPRDVVLREWWGAGRAPAITGPVVLSNPGDPLAVRRLAVQGVEVQTLALRGAFQPAVWQPALEGVVWHAASAALVGAASTAEAVPRRLRLS